MKKWAALIFLVATAFAQQTNQDFWPASPGLNLGKSNQRWNANVNNINISGTCTINGASCLGSGTITGATNNGGLVATGHTLGLLKTCSTGQILSWNGTAWACTSAGSGLPAGLDTQIQVNSSGGFGASPNFTFNLGTSTFSLSGTANISGPLTVTGALTNSALGPGGPFCVQETNGVFSSTGSACGSGGGSIGPGTTNKLTLWTSSTTVGNSDLTQSTGVSISTSDRIQINSNYLQASLTSASGCTIVNPALGLSNNPSCYSVFGLAQLASGTNSSSGILAGLYGTSSSGIGTVTGNPYIVGVYGLATAGGTGTHSWVAGLVGQSNTNNIGTVAVSSGVVALGETGAFGAGGGSATLLDGLDAQIQIQHASETSARTAGVYVRSPVLTGASTHNYGLYIEDQTVGAGNNTDPWGIFEAGSAKNQLGGSLTLAGIVGSTQCLHVNSAGLISGTGADCGSGGATFPSGTGIPQVSGGSSWGTTLSVLGTGSVLLSSSATATSLICVTCNLGTPTALTLTAATGLPLSTGVTGTVQISNLGASGTPSATTFLRGDNAWATPAGSGNVTGPGASTTHGIASYGDTTGTLIESNTLLATNVTSQTSNGASNQVCTYTGANKICVPGSVTVAMLATTATTVNSQTCTLGSTCTIPFQTNGNGGNTSQAGVVFTTSTTNAVGLTVTPVNSATNVEKFEITGNTYTGNAANLTPGAALSVSSITATTTNSTTMAGTFAGSPTFSGNPTFSASPVFSAMGAGGPFCVQETSGVLSSTGVACGSGGGAVGPGTVNGLAYFNASSTVASVASTVEGQLVVFHHTGPPTAVSPSLSDNGSGPIVTTPYVIQCDSATTLLDRGTTIPFASGASVVTIPDSTGSGCSGLAAILEPIGVSLTLNASGSDTFRVLGNGAALSGQTSVTITDGEYASISQNSSGVGVDHWTIRVTQGGSVTSVVIGAGLASTQSPLTTTGTMSIASGGVTNTMLAGSITVGKIASQAANTIMGNWTSGSTSPSSNAMASCSGNNNGEIYTTNTGLGCGTNFAQLNVAQTQSALYTFGTNISIGGVTATGATGTGKVVFDTSPTVTSATLTGASTVVPSGATFTIQSGGTLTCAVGSTCPTGTGTVTHTLGALSGNAIVTGNGGDDIQTAATTSTLSSAGNMVIAGTFQAAGAITFPFAGTSGVAGVTISGAPFTGASPLPQVNMTTTGSAACTWSANGVFIGVCPATGFTGNLLDFHAANGAASVYSVNYLGNMVGSGTINFTSASALGGSTTNYLLKGAASDTNTAAVLTVNSGSSSNQPTVDFKASNNTMFQVCNWTGPLGGTVFGANVTCANMTDQGTEFGRNTFQTSLDQNLIREYYSITNQTNPFLEMNTATTAGAGFDFVQGWTGVTPGTTYHTGGTKTFSIRGDGLFIGTFAAGSTAHGVLISEGLATAAVATATGSAGQCLISGGASSDPAWGTCASGGSGTVTSVGLAGTANQITVIGSSPITTSGSWTLSLPSSVGLGTDGSVAGTLVLSNSAAAFHSTISSGATANNTIKLFATVPTNGDMFYCVVASTTCTLTDANFLASNVVLASAPGVGIAHFAGSTQTLTSSLIVAADITSATITGTQVNTNLKTRAIPFNFGAPEGSALSTGLVRYVTVPYGCTINGYDISADSGTATIKFWKVATGTALPTVSNIISTSGVQLTTGTTVRSSTTSDFTTTTITAGDILAATNTATSAAKFLQAEIECTVP